MNHGEKIQELLGLHQAFHSDLQVDQFITYRAGGTLYGMFVQAVRELHGRLHSMAQMFLDREEAKAKEDLAEAKRKELVGELPNERNWSKVQWAELRLAEVDILRERHKALQIDGYLADTLREVNLFYGQAVALKARLGDLTPERRRELDRATWRFWIRKEAALDFLERGPGAPLSRKVVELIWAFPPEERMALKEECSADPAKLIQEMETRDPIPDWRPANLTLADVRNGVNLNGHRTIGTDERPSNGGNALPGEADTD